MRDTIGAHLAEAMKHSRYAGGKGLTMIKILPAEEWEEMMATHIGAAAGHAFRAAELAYESGRHDEIIAEARAALQELQSVVHWNGEE